MGKMGSMCVRDHDDVIMASEVVTGNASMPSRVVLRNVGTAIRPEYVTHMERFEKIEGPAGTPGEHGVPSPEGWKHWGYDTGNYYSDMKAAILDFAERCSRHLTGYGKIRMEELMERPKSVVLAIILDEEGYLEERLGATVTNMSPGDVDKLKLAVVTKAVADGLPGGSRVLVERFDLVDTIKLSE
jgi:hypothetical protein